jgi:hypothetical protein
MLSPEDIQALHAASALLETEAKVLRISFSNWKAGMPIAQVRWFSYVDEKRVHDRMVATAAALSSIANKHQEFACHG